MSSSEVTLVIPGKNAAQTLPACLDSALPLLHSGDLGEIIFVDDGSTDSSGDLAKQAGVTVVHGPGEGPGKARNIGTTQAATPLIWYVDADAVIESGALPYLLEHMRDPTVAGVGGSYGNMRSDTLLSCLIHEEIIERHLQMSTEVNFLATFNVVYRKEALNQVGGFDELFVKAQDAELAFRIRKAGWKLHFERRSRVKHFHLDRLDKYLAVQARQGYWRTWLYLKHPEKMVGDSYAGGVDYLAPPIAILSIGCAALSPWLPGAGWASAALLAALAGLQLPMTARICQRLGYRRYWLFGVMSFVRSFARGLGMACGVAAVMRDRLRFSR